jgi:Protein of unknown function (DUF1329)
MKLTQIAVCALGLIAAMHGVHAAVSDDEAKKLGNELTPFGAEVAANKDGTIPAYTGGMTKPPAGWDKSKPGVRPDPFASDKVLFSITSKNMDQYADKLTDGVKAMLKKYPTFRIDVYPTHRSAAFPKYVLDSTVKNATRCKTVEGGIAIEGCIGGLPFPIPKTGNEVMWNAAMRYIGHSLYGDASVYYVDGGGRATLASSNDVYEEFPNYDPKATSNNISWMVRSLYNAPARVAGEQVLIVDPTNWATEKRKAYQYIPGQRRVKLAPDLSYDTPQPNAAGIIPIDQAPVINGSLDRFDFKLVGKKEIYLPYNTYKLGAGGDAVNCGPEKLLTPSHWNVECVRWELHRTWVVEGTLKPGKRHIYTKRVYHLDEDGFNGSMTDMFDASGQLWRVGFSLNSPRYDEPAPFADVYGTFDLLAGSWIIANWDKPGSKGVFAVPRPSPNFYTPDALVGSGIR